MYHFIGIKGAGMSALAIILKQLGNDVKGSDVDKHFFTEEGLIKNNIEFYVYDEKNIRPNDIIIKGASITNDNPELIKAKELKLKIYEYNEMVGELTKKLKTITIAGCHGKTTTTAMMAHVLNNIVGISYLIGDGTGYANLENEFFALEACEYKRHFLAYQPYYAVITNIDLDHVDYFKGIDDVIDAYQEYASKAIKKVIAYGEDKHIKKMTLKNDIFYFGLNKDDNLYATEITYHNKGIKFKVIAEGEEYGNFDLPLYGEHQLLDALAVISICYLENINPIDVQKHFSTFKGAKRRFSETIIENNVIIDDYAHHPAEIISTINAVKQKYPNKKIVAIFQPHTFTRTKEFANDLVDIFNEVDASYIMDIHPAREKQEDFPDITSNIIINKTQNSYHIDINESEKLAKYNNTVFVFMSPNDIKKLENDLKNKLEIKK